KRLRLNVLRKIEKLIAEAVQRPYADRTDDVRCVVRRDLGRKRVVRDVVLIDLQRELDVRLGAGPISRVALRDRGALRAQLFRVSACSEADEPPDEDLSVRRQSAGRRRLR